MTEQLALQSYTQEIQDVIRTGHFDMCVNVCACGCGECVCVLCARP